MKEFLCIFGHKLATIMINGQVRCLRCDKYLTASNCSKAEIEDAKRRAEEEMPSMKYSDPGVPTKYKCQKCGKQGCKLWRDYNTFGPDETLRCCDCTVKQQHPEWLELPKFIILEDGRNNGSWLIRDKTANYAEGFNPKGDEDYCFCDQIGWMVPAVPTEDGVGYWGYTSVPDPGVEWWKKLPLRV